MAKFFQDDKGNGSSMRLLMAVWMIGVFAVWAIISLTKGEMPDLPSMIGTVIMAILAAKVWQKYPEAKTGPAPTDDKPQ
jgi:hypothetical protein